MAGAVVPNRLKKGRGLELLSALDVSIKLIFSVWLTLRYIKQSGSLFLTQAQFAERAHLGEEGVSLIASTQVLAMIGSCCTFSSLMMNVSKLLLLQTQALRELPSKSVGFP